MLHKGTEVSLHLASKRGSLLLPWQKFHKGSTVNMSLFILSQVSIVLSKGWECPELTPMLSILVNTVHYQAFYQKAKQADLNVCVFLHRPLL